MVIPDQKQFFGQLLMNPIQLLSSQKQRLRTAPDWLGSVLLHVLIVVVVVKIGSLHTKKAEIVWVSLSDIVMEVPQPVVAPQPKTIDPEPAVAPQSKIITPKPAVTPRPKIIVPEPAQPQATIPVGPAENVDDRAELEDKSLDPEVQYVAQNITIEPELTQPKRQTPLKIRKADRIKQKLAKPADSSNSIVPQAQAEAAQPEQVMTRNPLPTTVKTKTVPVETKETPAVAETRYLQANFTGIRSKVSDNIRYPTMARRQGWQGKVQVQFSILLSGEIDNVQVLSSSGYSLLDREALQAVKLAAPFPAPPVMASITIPVTFVLN